MISSIYNGTQSMHTKMRPFGAANSKEFGSLLNDSIQGKSSSSVPDKWIDGGTNSAVGEVLKYLESIGKDTERREPTHDITDEQIEWLRSRHDLGTLHKKESNSPEMQNFYADLVYLNVFSPEDTRTAVTKYPIIPAHIVAWGECPAESPYTEKFSFSDCGDLADMAMLSLKTQSRFLDAIRERSEDPARYDPRDADTIADMEKLIRNKTGCCEVLQKIFGKL